MNQPPKPDDDASPDEGAEFAGLLAAAQRQDPAGFEGLVRLVDYKLVGFARARGADDPEGLANEVLVRAFGAIDGFDGGLEQFRAWVFTIARNRLIDERRRFGRRVRSRPADPSTLPERAVVDDAAEDLAGSEAVEEILSELSDAQREVVLLRIVAGLSVEETAEAVGRRPGAVRTMQHRALRTLRRHLEAREIGDATR